jgi:hypothetical protein
MAGFVQIIEYQSSRPDDIKALSDEFRQSRQGWTGPESPSRITVVADRDRPNHYMSIVEFDSYELAMKNSQSPETSQFADRMQALCDGPPTFLNLDVMQTLEMA